MASGSAKRSRQASTEESVVATGGEASDPDIPRYDEPAAVGTGTGGKRVRAIEPLPEEPISTPLLKEFFYIPDKLAEPAVGEIVLLALCLTRRIGLHDNRTLTRWKDEVLSQREIFEQLRDKWAPPATWTSGNCTDNVSGVLRSALSGWSLDDKGALASALHQLGAAEEQPSAQGVATYLGKLLKKELKGPKQDSRCNALPRYNFALVPVAELIHSRGSELRKVFDRADQRPEEGQVLPPPALSISELRVQNNELRESNAALKLTIYSLRKYAQSWKARAQALQVVVTTEKVAAREESRAKLKEMRRALEKEVRPAEQACAAARVKGQICRANALRNQANARKRVAEAALAHAEKLSQRRLERAQVAEHELAASKAEADIYFHKYSEAVDAQKQNDDIAAKVASMPTWRPISGAGRGRAKMEWGTRVVIYSMLAMMCPASAVGAIIVAIVSRTAPWLKPVGPTTATVRELRFELRLVEEALAGRRVASAHRIRQLGFDETTKFQDPSMVTSVLVEPHEGAKPEVVILRAAYSTGGGTSELLVKAMEEKCFERLRGFLRGWQATCKRMHPEHVWTGPDPELCGLQRLGGGGAVQSDTCTPARCTKRLLVEEVARQVEAKHPNWFQLSETDKEAATRVHTHNCWQHIRNIFLKAMSEAQNGHVKEKLKQQLEAFAPHERMTTDFDQLLRADYKEFHHGGRYYKGKGKEFTEWLRDKYPSDFYMHLERAEGGRQDLDFDAAVPMYINRKYMVEFLQSRVFERSHKNILEDFLFVTHGTVEYIAMMRANSIIDILIARPMRWLAGKSADLVDWSPISMGLVLDTVEQLFARGAVDGSIFLDPQLDVFKTIADTQPAFREYLDNTFNKQTVLSPDGKTKHLAYKLALAECLTPQDESNRQTRDLTIEFLQVQCAAAIRKLHDTRTVLPEYLTSQNGNKCFGNQAQAHEETKGTEATNDKFAESVFGVFDRVLKQYGGISREAASGLSQASRAKSFFQGETVLRRKQQEPPPPGLGYFHTLPIQEQEALVEYVRTTVRESRKVDRAENAEVAEYVKAKAKTNSELDRQALITEWGYGMSFFERWQERGVRSIAAMNSALRQRESTQEKLDWLREQIEMRTRGLQWIDFRTHWSSSCNEETGSVDELTCHLKSVVEEERSRRAADDLPESAPAPIMQRKTYKELGTPSAQAKAFSGHREEISEEELREAAQRERARLEAAGEIDLLEDRQPAEAPDFSHLVGREIQVRWRYWVKDSSKKSGRRSEYIWCDGEVLEVADGRTTKKSPKCKTVLPWGCSVYQVP